MKKLLSLLLVCAMIVPIVGLPISASAAQTEYHTVGTYKLEKDDARNSSGNYNISVDENVIKTARESIRNHDPEFNVIVEIEYFDEDYVYEYVDAIMDAALDHTGNPIEGDYLAYQMSNWHSDMILYGDFSGYYMSVTYTIAYFTTKEQEEELNDKVNEIISSLKLDGKSDYEKIKAIYDYLCDNVSYDYYAYGINKELSHSAYAALINGKAVCQGYANALYRLMLTVGVDCRIVAGLGDGEAHAWNIVRLNDKYYLLDSTWDAARKPYEYFLCGKNDFADHSADEKFTTTSFNSKYPIALNAFDFSEFDNTDTSTDTSTDEDTDTGTDTSTDDDTDASTDTSTDEDTDTGTDTSTDEDTDTSTDTSTDDDTDTSTDTATEDDTDTSTDTATEDDTDTSTDTSTEDDTDTSTDSTTDSDTDTSTDSNTDIDPDTDFDIIGLIGDISGDEDITVEDSLIILRFSVGLGEIPDDKIGIADINNDGLIDSGDSLEVLRYSVGLPTDLRIGTFLKRV